MRNENDAKADRLLGTALKATSCHSQEETSVSQLHTLLQHISDVAEVFWLGILKCLKITQEKNKLFMQLKMKISLPGLRYIFWVLYFNSPQSYILIRECGLSTRTT